jgi:hypothetical protein
VTLLRAGSLALCLAACSESGPPPPGPSRPAEPAPPAPRAQPPSAPAAAAAATAAAVPAASGVVIADDALWNEARAVDAAALRELAAFFHELSDSELAAHFGRRDAAALRSSAPDTIARLRTRSFRLETTIAEQRAATGVFADEPANGVVPLRLVWPLDLGGGVRIAVRRPIVNHGTGSAVIEPRATWLFDHRPEPGWLEARRTSPGSLRYRAVWKPLGARTSPAPILMVRVVRWQVFDGQRLLHAETDDR